jgi:hypothetical protein
MNKDQVMGNVDNFVCKVDPDAGTQVGSTKQQTMIKQLLFCKF